MGKVVKSVGNLAKKAVSSVGSLGTTALGGAAGFALGGIPGAALGAGAGSLLGNLSTSSDSKDVQTGSTGLSPRALQQFDFAGGLLESGLLSPISVASADFSGANKALRSIDFGSINQASNALSGFSGTGDAKSALDRLGAFSGTAGAKAALNRVGSFKGTPEAFRTLAALEQFGKKEQDFVTAARKAVLSFDEGFQSKALPLLQEAAEGKFLTEAAGNPFIRDLINTAQRPVIENFNEQVLPGILSTFAGTGGVGASLRGGVTAANARDLQRTLGDISSTIGFNVFESERGKQLTAQQAILGFEDQSLTRKLNARTINLQAAQTTAAQLLAARQSASVQATSLSAQKLAGLQTAAQGQVSLSAQRQASLAGAAAGRVSLSAQKQASLAAALQGRISAGSLQASQGNSLASIAAQQQARNTANAQLERDRINQLLQLQQNSRLAGTTTSSRLTRPGL